MEMVQCSICCINYRSYVKAMKLVFLEGERMGKPIKVDIECWELIAKDTGEIYGMYMSKIDALVHMIYYAVRDLRFFDINNLNIEIECSQLYRIKKVRRPK